MFGFQYGLWFIDKSIEKVKTAKSICVNGHVAVCGMVKQCLSDGNQFSPVDGGGVCQSTRVDEEGQPVGGGVDPCPNTGDAFDSEEAPISLTKRPVLYRASKSRSLQSLYLLPKLLEIL